MSKARETRKKEPQLEFTVVGELSPAAISAIARLLIQGATREIEEDLKASESAGPREPDKRRRRKNST